MTTTTERTPQDAEAVARETLRQTLRSYVRIERGPEGSHPKTDRDIAADDAANEQEIDALIEAVERRVRSVGDCQAHCLERRANIDHIKALESEVELLREFATKVREADPIMARMIANGLQDRAATQDHHTGGDDGQ